MTNSRLCGSKEVVKHRARPRFGGDSPQNLERGLYKMLTKIYSAHDFKMNDYAYKPIKADGYVSSCSGVYEVNYSSILTRLIQEAGRFCEQFASDLFIDWKSIEKQIDCADVLDLVFLFGFRQSGVDGNSFILSRYNSGAYRCPEAEYRSMWRLDITADGDEIEMILGRVF